MASHDNGRKASATFSENTQYVLTTSGQISIGLRSASACNKVNAEVIFRSTLILNSYFLLSSTRLRWGRTEALKNRPTFVVELAAG